LRRLQSHAISIEYKVTASSSASVIASIMPTVLADPKGAALRTGFRLEVFTVVWMLVEAALAIGAGIAARSVLLTGFGFDSVIELLSGVTLLWRLSSRATQIEGVERRATQISAVLLVLLCTYLLFFGLGGLVVGLRPEGSVVGVVVAAAAVLVMPMLAWRKRQANLIIGSAALRADIAETITCAYMAGATLAGAGLNLIFGWWWAEYAGALALLVFVLMETKEAIEAARA
jgi:divalent metal cation (Fe/Co/Zn/Cd) transporter